jgi:hypothetical protein
MAAAAFLAFCYFSKQDGYHQLEGFKQVAIST